MATNVNPYGLTDEDNLAYSQKRRSIQANQTAQDAAAEYGRFAAQQRFARQNAASNVTWRNNRMHMDSPFLRAGIGHSSPLWHGALQNYYQRQIAAQNDAAANQYDQLHQYDLNEAGINQQAADALTALEEQRQAKIRQYLSGLGAAQQLGITV